MSEFKEDALTKIITELKCTMDHHHVRAQEWQHAADVFRGESLASTNKISDQQLDMMGKIISLETTMKNDVVKWSVILPNSKNWKFYLIAAAMLIGTKLGADFIKACFTALLQIHP